MEDCGGNWAQVRRTSSSFHHNKVIYHRFLTPLPTTLCENIAFIREYVNLFGVLPTQVRYSHTS